MAEDTLARKQFKRRRLGEHRLADFAIFSAGSVTVPDD